MLCNCSAILCPGALSPGTKEPCRDLTTHFHPVSSFRVLSVLNPLPLLRVIILASLITPTLQEHVLQYRYILLISVKDATYIVAARGFRPRVTTGGFVVDGVPLGQVSSGFFGFPLS